MPSSGCAGAALHPARPHRGFPPVPPSPMSIRDVFELLHAPRSRAATISRYRVGAQRSRFEHLIGIDDRNLCVRRAARSPHAPARDTPGAPGKTARRSAPTGRSARVSRVRFRDLRRVEIGAQHAPLLGLAFFDFGDNCGTAGSHGAAQGTGEIARRRGRHRFCTQRLLGFYGRRLDLLRASPQGCAPVCRSSPENQSVFYAR